MDTRDFFAAFIMASLKISDSSISKHPSSTPKELATRAYELADAMMIARKRK